MLCAHRLEKHSLEDTEGTAAVHALVKLRLLLEKVRPMESRLKHQIQKLVRTASKTTVQRDTGEDADDDEEIDSLAFRPNPNALASTSTSRARPSADGADEEDASGAYRPPKVAPVVYNPDARQSRREREKNRLPSRSSALLADLSVGMSSNPYETSMSGVGGGAAVGTSGSSRARALRHMQDFEEDNYSRLSLSKRDAKRRRRDEQDVALGGIGLTSRGNRVGAGVEEEFGDLLRDTERNRRRKGTNRDIYETLKDRSRASSTLDRASQHVRDVGGRLDTEAPRAHRPKKSTREHKRRSR